jgi:cytochrome b6-f complex iron-sulfur subunit
MRSSLHDAPVSRRDLVGWLGRALLAAGTALTALFTWRFARPAAVSDLARRVEVGPLAAIPQGSQSELRPHELLVLHDAGGLYAVSTRCTHLGCSLRVEAEGFACPCHGARFTLEGAVRNGPAPSPLPWHRLSFDERGTVWAHLDERVPPGTRAQP